MADSKKSNKDITVVLDPGHGATYNKWNTVDPGALGPSGKNEKDYTAEIAIQLGTELVTKYGYNVVFTRRADVTVKQQRLAWRVDLAHNKNADYFISIHLDSFDAAKNRFAAYYWVRGNNISKEGKKFAESVTKAVTPRGFTKSVVKSANHYVTRNTRVPSILVECGNIQHPDNEMTLINIKFVEEFAKGIDNYIQSAE